MSGGRRGEQIPFLMQILECGGQRTTHAKGRVRRKRGCLARGQPYMVEAHVRIQRACERERGLAGFRLGDPQAFLTQHRGHDAAGRCIVVDHHHQRRGASLRGGARRRA